MPNAKNKEQLKELKTKVAKAKSMVFTDYKGLTSNQANLLRRKLAESGADLEIAKNTLLKISLKEAGLDLKDVEKTFEQETAVIFGYEDALSPIKKLYEFLKTSPLPKVKLGFVEGMFQSAENVEMLSKLPSREELIAKVLAGFNSPISGFVNVLSGTKRNFVYALSAVAKKKESAN
jgi:large subunit ribosomal protein L10